MNKQNSHTFIPQIRKAHIVSSQIQSRRGKAVEDAQELSQGNEKGHELSRGSQAVHTGDVVPLKRHLDVDYGADIDQEIERPVIHGVVVLSGLSVYFAAKSADKTGRSDKGE